VRYFSLPVNEMEVHTASGLNLLTGLSVFCLSFIMHTSLFFSVIYRQNNDNTQADFNPLKQQGLISAVNFGNFIWNSAAHNSPHNCPIGKIFFLLLSYVLLLPNLSFSVFLSISPALQSAD